MVVEWEGAGVIFADRFFGIGALMSAKKRNEVFTALRRLMLQPGAPDHVTTEYYKLSLAGTFAPEKIKEIFPAHPDHDDRGAAIVLSSMIERSLERALMTHFTIDDSAARNLFSYTEDGILSTFNAKVAIGFALGIYDERMQSDLKWTARIRNVFAHARVDVGFHVPEISDAVDQIQISQILRTNPETNDTRRIFSFAAFVISDYLSDTTNPPLRWKNVPNYHATYVSNSMPQK